MPWKGLCALHILLSHYNGYIVTDLYDEIYLLIRSGIGQGAIVLFFVLSFLPFALFHRPRPSLIPPTAFCSE